jgi:hypothetical protein
MSLRRRAQTVETIIHILRNSPEEIQLNEFRVFILVADEEGRLIAVQCATEEERADTIKFAEKLYPEAGMIGQYPSTVEKFLRFYDSLETVQIN